jgi:SMC interacting uncharacterized protein involved in chromosome segregation
VREEHAHLLKQATKRAEQQLEEAQSACLRLEGDVGQLRAHLEDKNRLLAEIQEKVEEQNSQGEMRLEQAQEEANARLLEIDRLNQIIEINQNEYEIEVTNLHGHYGSKLDQERHLRTSLLARAQSLVAKHAADHRKQLKALREEVTNRFAGEVARSHKQS